MNLKKSRLALKWNLMLLAGRPVVMLSLLLVGYGLLIQSTVLVLTWVSLIGKGFVVGWTGNIGKTPFEA